MPNYLMTINTLGVKAGTVANFPRSRVMDSLVLGGFAVEQDEPAAIEAEQGEPESYISAAEDELDPWADEGDEPDEE